MSAGCGCARQWGTKRYGKGSLQSSAALVRTGWNLASRGVALQRCIIHSQWVRCKKRACKSERPKAGSVNMGRRGLGPRHAPGRSQLFSVWENFFPCVITTREQRTQTPGTYNMCHYVSIMSSMCMFMTMTVALLNSSLPLLLLTPNERNNDLNSHILLSDHFFSIFLFPFLSCCPFSLTLPLTRAP